MRGARRLYALHLGVGALALGLISAGSTAVVLASDFSAPSFAAVSDACANWLASGGPAAGLALFVIALAGTVLALALRSIVCHVRAGRAFVAGLSPGPPAVIDGLLCRTVDSGEPLAFCTGYVRPHVYLSRGLIDCLSAEELRAVVAHERHHVRTRDPLRRLLARALADGLFFIPALRSTGERYAALGELAADEAAVAALDGRRPLAGALLKLSSEEPARASVAGIDPERVDRLLGDPDSGRCRLPRGTVGWSAVSVAALVAVFAATSTLQPGLDGPRVLAAACMVGMFGAPAALTAMALVYSQRAIRTRRAP